MIKTRDSLETYRKGVTSYELGDLYVGPHAQEVAIIVTVWHLIPGHAPTSYQRHLVETAAF